jgi:hypothetical protein
MRDIPDHPIRLASRAFMCCVPAMRYPSLLSFVPLALLLCACGPGTTTVSCEVGAADAGAADAGAADAGSTSTNAHVCTQYANEPVDAVTSFDGACLGVSGNGCSLMDVLGTCSTSSPDYMTSVTASYYSWGDGTAYSACAACTSDANTVPGVWTMPGLTIPVAVSADCPCTATSDCTSPQTCKGGKCQ